MVRRAGGRSGPEGRSPRLSGGLSRFLAAQAEIYGQALRELRAGRKATHWMWFVFPQIAGLGLSPTARLYAIADRDEAAAYLTHPVLGPRLREAAEALAPWIGKRSLVAILGEIDAMKLRSSMTLFEAVAETPEEAAPFARLLDGFCEGRRDPETLRRL